MKKRKTLLSVISTKSTYLDIKGEEIKAEINFNRADIDNCAKVGIDLKTKLSIESQEFVDSVLTKKILSYIRGRIKRSVAPGGISNLIELANCLPNSTPHWS